MAGEEISNAVCGGCEILNSVKLSENEEGGKEDFNRT
jgi:hypothetical protein